MCIRDRAKGVDENGKEFEQRIYINDVNPSNATVVEMRAVEAHYKVEKQGGFTSLPLEAGNMGLNDRRDFIAMFKKSIEDLNKLGRFDLSLLWTKSMDCLLYTSVSKISTRGWNNVPDMTLSILYGKSGLKDMNQLHTGM